MPAAHRNVILGYQTQHLLRKLEPLYGKKLGSVTTHDIFAIIDRQKRVAANLTFGAARTFFRFCARRRLIEKSPLQDLGKPHKMQSRARVLTTDDLVQGDNSFFAATGVTDGELLRGVRYDGKGASTQSLVMRSRSGTVRLITARHRLDKLRGFAVVDYA